MNTLKLMTGLEINDMAVNSSMLATDNTLSVGLIYN